MTAQPHETQPHDTQPAGTRSPYTGPSAYASIASEQGMLLAAGSAVMYQLAVPGVGLGVAEHSTTLERPVDRLRTTLTYVYAMTLGTPEEQQAIARMVNKAHGPVRAAGRYSAFDPDLQLWVAATLYQQGEFIYEKLFGPMPEEMRDGYYRASWIYGTALQVKDEQWPPTRADFQVYWDTTIAGLESVPSVQDYARRLLSTEDAPLFSKLVLPLQDLMTRGNLDPRTREVLGLTWSAKDQRRYDLFWKVFPRFYRLIPRRLRHLHAHLILRDMRRRMRKGGRVI